MGEVYKAHDGRLGRTVAIKILAAGAGGTVWGRGSENGPSVNLGGSNAFYRHMTNLMSKFLSLDVPLYEVVRRTTIDPAVVIKRPEFGHLSVGAVADVAVLRLDTGTYGFLDAQNLRMMGTKMLTCELTLKDGSVEWDLNGRAGQDWKTATRTVR
jgi:dihydroorotase